MEGDVQFEEEAGGDHAEADHDVVDGLEDADFFAEMFLFGGFVEEAVSRGVVDFDANASEGEKAEGWPKFCTEVEAEILEGEKDEPEGHEVAGGHFVVAEARREGGEEAGDCADGED